MNLEAIVMFIAFIALTAIAIWMFTLAKNDSKHLKTAYAASFGAGISLMVGVASLLYNALLTMSANRAKKSYESKKKIHDDAVVNINSDINNTNATIDVAINRANKADMAANVNMVEVDLYTSIADEHRNNANDLIARANTLKNNREE